jgi:hypothetical protein
VTAFADICKKMEAFETERWAVDGILDRELTTVHVLDPCAGLGMIARCCADRGLRVIAMDAVDWEAYLPARMRFSPMYIGDFLSVETALQLRDYTVVMNPPFSLAEAFVEKAMALGARKVICFQRQAWRESNGRRSWWEKNPPARVWVCGARATCWRFDLLECQDPEGFDHCANAKRRGKRLETQGCSRCLGGVPTSNAWYVWERGHKGAEVTSAIYPSEDPS